VLLDRYMELFQGRHDVFASQEADGAYYPVRRPIFPDDYKRHLQGADTYGIYTVRPDDTTRLIAFDIDTMDPEPRISIFQALRDLRVQEHSFLFEFSGRKGFHIWLPFADWYPAGLAYRAARAVLQVAGVKCEAYPKQPSVGDGYGNLIKLPGGIHRVTGQPSRFIGRSIEKVVTMGYIQLNELADAFEEPVRPAHRGIKAGNLGPYGQAALTNECAKVAEAPDGDRNNQLNRSAYALFGLVAGGVLDEDDVEVNLSNAAIVAGLDISETVKTLASAKSAGMRRPIGPREN
jgi:hypothetical protein